MTDSNGKETGGPAFPSSKYDAEYERHFQEGGMELRDYFAAKAMQGVLASPNLKSVNFKKIANDSYEMADAMLEARK